MAANRHGCHGSIPREAARVLPLPDCGEPRQTTQLAKFVDLSLVRGGSKSRASPRMFERSWQLCGMGPQKGRRGSGMPMVDGPATQRAISDSYKQLLELSK